MTHRLAFQSDTNATITYASNNQIANLSLGGQSLQAIILSPTSAQFTTQQPVRLATDPALPAGSPDLSNPGVSVLSIVIEDPGTTTVQVLFNPQWPDMASSAYVTPSTSVPLAQWTTATPA